MSVELRWKACGDAMELQYRVLDANAKPETTEERLNWIVGRRIERWGEWQRVPVVEEGAQ